MRREFIRELRGDSRKEAIDIYDQYRFEGAERGLHSSDTTVGHIMIRLTTKKVKEIHDYLIETEGGEPGIRDVGTLEYLIENINREDNAFEKAAWALLLADRHPFWDG